MSCCDRAVLGYIATSQGGIDGDMIFELLANCLVYRFGNRCRLPTTLQWLIDHGSCYTSRKTIRFARALGFEVGLTDPYRSKSNGMAEAVVKTFK